MISPNLFNVAKCKGVFPSLDKQFTAASFFNKNSTQSTCPDKQLKIRIITKQKKKNEIS